ncbi:amino acid adenylation domain-containing protein [Plantactinospora mayteni]|uniref:amino acid adenylation domain-containing protein n=1 Tax=Plantactinospora mayteni TaxID=566021 RepID=UPI0019423358|nr:amino acid adenylation domain-containing protein [Plantactinospora mayteni]
MASHVRQRPEAVAVRDQQGRALSYAELWRRSGRLAAALNRRGIGRGDIVVIALDRSLELVEAVLGAARSGAAYVLLDPVSPPLRNAHIVADVRAAAIVETAAPAPWRPASDVPRIVLPLDGDDDPDGDDAGSFDAADLAVGDDDLLYVAYTSGSTGRPKGVMASHRAVTHFVADTALVELTPSDTVASLASPASDATTFELWKPLASGSTIVVLPAIAELTVEDWAPLIERSGLSVMFVMPGLLELVAREQPAAFAGLDTLVFGGEALDPGTARRVCEAGKPRRLVLGYGPTETTVFATSFDCTAESIARRDRIPLGTALDGYDLAVLDPGLRAVPSGETGELCIGGRGVADGYLAQPHVSAERFVDHPEFGRIYRSGDLVRRLPSGDLEFVGRLDRQVKIRGYRVELEEVERSVLASGLVISAAVERIESPAAAYLACYFVPLPGAAPENPAVALAAAVATRLPGYMIPARWIPLPQMPRNGIGKIDRAALRGLPSADRAAAEPRP